jgi:hypothetical protein
MIIMESERIVDRERELQEGEEQARLAAIAARLPPPTVQRWSSGRKAAVAVAVINRVLSVEEAYRRYDLSEPELAAWLATYERFGTAGLRSTHAQEYRTAPRRKRSSSLPFS